MERPYWLGDPERMKAILLRNDRWAIGRGAVRCRPRASKLKPGDRWFDHPQRRRSPWNVALWEFPDDPSHKIEMLFRDGETALEFVRVLADWR